jgi:hypothetical protein
MTRLWIPLRPLEEERDPEKAQKLEEMIAILRKVSILIRQVADQKAEVKYAKRCLYGVVAWTMAIFIIVLVSILVSNLR